jgi:hypothetical protein
MGPVWTARFACSALFYGLTVQSLSVRWRTGMEDLFYIALTIVVFGVLWLILKGVERFER